MDKKQKIEQLSLFNTNDYINDYYAIINWKRYRYIKVINWRIFDMLFLGYTIKEVYQLDLF